MVETTSPPENGQKDPALVLEQYAAATRTKVLATPSDIDSKDKVLDEMSNWCREQKNIVVLKSATILSSDPTSRAVQNCKSLLLSKGIHPGQVYAATQPLIGLLLASSGEEDGKKQKGETSASFSDQQKHLRDLVFEAVKQQVSDIHIQVRQSYTKIRMRQHGELKIYAEW